MKLYQKYKENWHSQELYEHKDIILLNTTFGVKEVTLIEGIRNRSKNEQIKKNLLDFNITIIRSKK